MSRINMMSIFDHKFKVLLHSFNKTNASFNLLRHLSIIKGPNDEDIIPVELSYASYENQETQSRNHPPILVLHGYLASKRNWIGTCKRLFNEINPQRKILAVDIRNHGDSSHSNEHTNYHVVEDFRHFIEQFKLKMVVLLGHSYGGLISMIFALFYPDLVEKLIIIDISPRDQTQNFHHIWTVLDTISKIKIPAKIPISFARNLMNQEMELRKILKSDRLFLLTQLIQKEDGDISWRFNLEVLKRKVIATGSFPEIKGKQFDNPSLFIGGEKSEMIRKQYEPDTKQYFPKAEFQYVPDAGHTVHADKPKQFVEICSAFLNRDS